MRSDDGLLYCGRKQCLLDLQTDAKEATISPLARESFMPYRPQRAMGQEGITPRLGVFGWGGED